MTSSRLVRGAKTRMFAFVCLVCVLGAVLFVFHGTQVRLTETQKQLVTCSQQKESFHAQLQVIFEYKERLEKSLNKEKSDHKQTKETLEKKIKDDKDQLETDFASKTDVLQQKNNNLQGQLEELREANEKLLEEKTRLAASLELTKKEIESQKVKNDENIENLKNDWFKKHEDCLQMGKQLEEYKMRALPESDRRNYLEKQHFQIKEENENLKQELSDCRDKKPSAAPVKNENEEIAPNVPMFKTFSSTPGINPDAVNGASSAKPGVENSKKDEHAVGSMPKKPTQESVVPLIQPGKVDDLAAGQGQIPIPPNPHPLGVLHKPNVEPDQEINNIQLPEDSEDNLIKQEQAKAQIGEPNAFIPVPDANRAEEEDEQAPQFKQPGKNPESYRAGDYDKEQPEEEDEEGELIDDEGDHLKDRAKVKILRQNPRNGGGVMVNPK